MNKMKNKDLIKDILTYLKDNEEARERFIKYYPDSIDTYYSFKPHTYDSIFDDFKDLGNDHKILTIICALSSPNRNPICSFLEIEEMREVSVELEIGIKTKTHVIIPINHAKTLRTIYLDALDEGKSHDEAYKLINKKYNELF